MPFFVWQKIDPDEPTLLAALDQAFARALAEQGNDTPAPAHRPAPQALPAHADTSRQGSHFWFWPAGPSPDERGPVIGIAWWTDVLGRRHWVVEAGQPFRDSSFVTGTPLGWCEGADDGDCTRYSHPLEQIYPERAGCWRKRKGRREWLVLCGCGACGPPERIGWTGDCCGPCFDRRLDEGISPGEPGPCLSGATPLAFAFDRDGRLIVASLNLPQIQVSAWSPWWNGPPLWQVQLGECQEENRSFHSRILECAGYTVVFICDDRFVVLDSRDGRILSSHQDDLFSRVRCLGFAGPTKELMVALAERGQHEPGSGDGATDLYCWDWRQGRPQQLPGTWGRGMRLAISADGSQVLVDGGSAFIECRNATSGAVLRQLGLPGAGPLWGVVVSDDHVFALAGVPQGNRLARWTISGPQPRSGLFARLTAMVRGTVGQEPDVLRPVSRDSSIPLALSPNGQLVVVAGWRSLSFHDTHSLDEYARVLIPSPVYCCEFAFSPDGETIAIRYGLSLFLWPLRHLLGD
jgi:hypothetical protein